MHVTLNPDLHLTRKQQIRQCSNSRKIGVEPLSSLELYPRALANLNHLVGRVDVTLAHPLATNQQHVYNRPMRIFTAFGYEEKFFLILNLQICTFLRSKKSKKWGKGRGALPPFTVRSKRVETIKPRIRGYPAGLYTIPLERFHHNSLTTSRIYGHADSQTCRER